MKSNILIITLTAASFFLADNLKAQPNAKLIVYRKGSPYGLLARYKVNVDNKEVTTLKNSSMQSVEITPGSHTISAKQPKRAVQLNAEAGKTYVVKYRTMLGIFGARPRLKVMTLDEAKKDSKLI